MKKFTELKENTPTVHTYRGYSIKEYEGKFHVQKTPGTTLSHHASKKDAKSRIDYYHRLPDKSMSHGDMVSLVNETKWHVKEEKEVPKSTLPSDEPKKNEESIKNISAHDKRTLSLMKSMFGRRPMKEETERERKSHAVRMAPAPTNDQLEKRDESDDLIKKNFETAQKKTADALASKEITKVMKESVGSVPGGGVLDESGPDTYKVGDHVIAKIGPHAGQVHRVIHVHPTGHLNITPIGHSNRYKLGAAKANPEDVTRQLEEAKKKPKKKFVPDPKIWKKLPVLSKLLGVKLEESIISRTTVQEVFQAAKAKKKEAGKDKKEIKTDPKKDPKKEKVSAQDFDKPKEFQDPGQAEPDQTEVQAKPPQFGGKDGDDAKPKEKKNNTPEPEKKGTKLVVKGPGADDKFQTDPIVTPVTTLPDTASARTGSQGVR
jgi:hypothetical protein